VVSHYPKRLKTNELGSYCNPADGRTGNIVLNIAAKGEYTQPIIATVTIVHTVAVVRHRARLCDGRLIEKGSGG
jgi:hypothetical protein